MDLFLYALAFILILSVTAFVILEIRASKGNADGRENFLLILGCRVRGDEAEETLRMRCEKAAAYLNEHKDIIAIACGGIVHDDQTKSEAQAIYEILVSKGVEGERIILEDKSQTTVQNFINARRIIDSKGLSHSPSTALLSSEFHLFRAAVIAKKHDLNCSTVAAPSPKKEKLKNYIREYFALIIFIIGGK